MPSVAKLEKIYRYPVKGFSPEALPRTALRQGQTLHNDRRYAVENGPSGFDPAHPKYFPKTCFLTLMRDERLAALRTHFDDDSHVLTILHQGADVARGNLETPEGRTAIESYLTDYCAKELKGPARVLPGGGHSFSDVARKVISIVNLASIAAIEQIVGQPVDPLRFRANFYVGGWQPWHELDMLDQTLCIGDARLKVVKRIVRCAAINVDPVTAARDLNIPHTLMRQNGHADCGIYAEVIADGIVAAGDAVTLPG